MASSRVMWWVRNLLHIETIFIIIIVCIILYIWITGKSPKINLPNLPRVAKKKKKHNKHEERCREIFAGIFRCRFKTCRPSWLKNPLTGKNLELDGYNPTIRTPLGLGLAFEYDGAQHSRFTPHFHRSTSDFVNQVKRDTWKDKRCREMGVLLIRIPHFIEYANLEKYIRERLIRERIEH